VKSLWIRVEAHEVDSLRVDALAEALDIPDAYALGLYVALGGAVAEHSPTGTIQHVSDRKLEEWARWRGKRGAFAAAARKILQDDAGELAEWRESMGKLLEQREKDRVRKLHGHSEEIPRNDRGKSVVTERNGTERNVSARSSHLDNSNKRSGAEHLAEDVEAASAPLAGAAEIEQLPPGANEFLARFYGNAPRERWRDVVAQLCATLGAGARLKRGALVRAGSPERLAAKIREVIAEGVRDPDKAIRVLLLKLNDTNDMTTAAVKTEQRERETDDRNRGRELVEANAWLEEHGDVEHTIVERLELDFPHPVEPGDDVLAISRSIARDALVLEAWRKAGAPELVRSP
jgi:hypothetical protein